MKPAPFSYAAPQRLSEALDLMAQYGPEARILAGGQTLGPMLNLRLVCPSLLVDVNRIQDFDETLVLANSIITGPLVRQRDALAEPIIRDSVPLMRLALPFVGHYQTRSRGTLCGSLAHADPTAELPLALLTLDGFVHVASAKRKRRIPASEFFLGALTTSREPDEIVTALEWPAAAPDWHFAFDEIGVRHHHVAVAACALAVQTARDGSIKQLSIGITGTGDRPILVDTWRYLGAKPSVAYYRDICDHARSSVPCISDLHASADYRRHLIGILIERCMRTVFRSHALASQ